MKKAEKSKVLVRGARPKMERRTVGGPGGGVFTVTKQEKKRKVKNGDTVPVNQNKGVGDEKKQGPTHRASRGKSTLK